ncbi:MAG: hypothetical protein GY723_06045 [bacterium]|nr:hypothetical protein [bacterium]MCP5071206.1 hypothetical protein [bacterium]
MSFVDRDQHDHLLYDLRSSDDEVRRLAVERLTTLPPNEAIPALVAQLADPSWRVRKAAIERLSETPETSAAIPALVEALADGENPGRRNAALETLTRCGSSALPVLFDACRGPDVDVRKQAVDALAGIGDPAAVPRLLEVLSDPDPNVRGAGAEALGCVGNEDCHSILLRLVSADPEILVRLSALRALDRLEAQVDTAELRCALDESLLCAAAYAVLGHNDEPGSVQVLLKGLESGGRSTREAALQALVRICARPGSENEARATEVKQAIGPEGEAFAFTTAQVREGDLPVRLAAVQILGLLGHAEAVVPMLDAACDEALSEVVLAALESMGQAVVPPIEIGFDDLLPEERRMACRALGAAPGEPARGVLLRALADTEHQVRADAARALGRHGMLEPIAELVALLGAAAREGGEWGNEELAASTAALRAIGSNDPAPVVEALEECLPEEGKVFRLAATEVIGAVGDSRQLELLTRLAADPEPPVRRAAVEGIASVSTTPPLETLRLALADEDVGVRIGAARALTVSADPEVMADLAHLTEDLDQRAQAAAFRALGRWASRHGMEQARPQILELVSAAIRRGGTPAMAGLEVLDRLGGGSAATLATAALGADDAELVMAAIGCVGRHAETLALAELLPLLTHDHWAVRAQVVDVLAERRSHTAVPAILRRLESETDEFVRSAIFNALDALE